MEFSLRKVVSGYSLITFTFVLIFVLDQAFPGLYYVKNLVASLGGGAALYYVFYSKSYFSNVTTLYAFLLASYLLFIFTTGLRELELSILILIAILSSFFLSFYLNSNRNLDPFFLGILCGFLTCIGLSWSIAFLVEFIILFLFQVCFRSHIKKKAVFLSCSLLLLLAFYLHFIEVHPGFHIGVLFLFGAAGAGGLQFFCLNKTEWEQRTAFVIYVFSNVILGFILKKEGEAFPDITLFFLMTIFCSFLFVYLISKIQDESLSAVIAGSKTLLRGVFFPLLYLLNGLFFDGAYFLWISSFVIHVFILLLFKFIFKNEDQDPILENEEKG